MFERTSIYLLAAGLAWLVIVPTAAADPDDDDEDRTEVQTQTTQQTTQTAQAPTTGQTQTTTTTTEAEIEEEDDTRARPFLGLDADLGVPTEEAMDMGWGLGLRLGSGVDIERVRLDLEGGFDYNRFPGGDAASEGSDGEDVGDDVEAAVNEDARAHLWRVVGGVRLGALIPIVPYVFGHVGYGRQVSDIGEDEDQAANGIAWDVGIGSDLVAVDTFQMGLHASYKSFTSLDEDISPDPMRWVGIGLHGQFGF